MDISNLSITNLFKSVYILLAKSGLAFISSASLIKEANSFLLLATASIASIKSLIDLNPPRLAIILDSSIVHS